MAPEQLEAFLDPGWDAVGAAADVYSLGLVVRELLTGAPPRHPTRSCPCPAPSRACSTAGPISSRPSPPRQGPPCPALRAESIVGRSSGPRPPGAIPMPPPWPTTSIASSNTSPCGTPRTRHGRNGRPTGYGENGVLATYRLVARGRNDSRLELRADYPGSGAMARFRGAIADLDQDRADHALPRLQALAREAPRSPVIAFYLADAYRLLDRTEEASVQLGRAWSEPGAKRVLRSGRVTTRSFPGLRFALPPVCSRTCSPGRRSTLNAGPRCLVTPSAPSAWLFPRPVHGSRPHRHECGARTARRLPGCRRHHHPPHGRRSRGRSNPANPLAQLLWYSEVRAARRPSGDERSWKSRMPRRRTGSRRATAPGVTRGREFLPAHFKNVPPARRSSRG